MSIKYDYRIKITITENYSRWYMPQRRLRKWYGMWKNMNHYFGGGFDKRLGCIKRPQAEELIAEDKIAEYLKLESKRKKTPVSTQYIKIND